MACAPRERFHAYVDVVATGVAYFQNRGHIESGAGMAVILDRDFRMLGLDVGDDLS